MNGNPNQLKVAHQQATPPPVPQEPEKAKRNWTWVWLMTLAIIFTAHSAVLLLGGVPIKKESQKWEYGAQFALDTQLDEKFSKAGDEHWEIVHCRRARDGEKWGYECLFKRPKQ